MRHTEDSKRIRIQYFSSADQLLMMALAIRGPEFSSWSTTVHDIQLERALDVLCSMHLGFETWGFVDRSIEKLRREKLLMRI